MNIQTKTKRNLPIFDSYYGLQNIPRSEPQSTSHVAKYRTNCSLQKSNHCDFDNDDDNEFLIKSNPALSCKGWKDSDIPIGFFLCYGYNIDGLLDYEL
jgi:hypothetical protein